VFLIYEIAVLTPNHFKCLIWWCQKHP